MEPLIEDGDIVIIDRDLPCEPGKVILCLVNDELVCGRLEKRGDDLVVMNNEEICRLDDYLSMAVVIQVIKTVG